MQEDRKKKGKTNQRGKDRFPNVNAIHCVLQQVLPALQQPKPRPSQAHLPSEEKGNEVGFFFPFHLHNILWDRRDGPRQDDHHSAG